jgi:endonuclease/exonuclease/phosphatase (EEP) superfamily protein YafD
MRVLTWNLFHGRSVPGAGRDLLDEFAARIAGWPWDVALLQEVPPWWPPRLAEAAGAHARWVLTSRNELLPLRRFLAERLPDVIKSNGGGANAMLVRGAAPGKQRTAVLTQRPERRTMHAVPLADGTWIANLHASNRPAGQSRGEGDRALALLAGWAGDAPFVFGGDVNQTRPRFPTLAHVAAHHVDHLFARGFTGRGELLDAGRLSDHNPLAVTLTRAG